MTDKERAEYTKILASNLPMLRKACGLPQREFAGRIGINRSTLSLIEKRKDMTWPLFISAMAVFEFYPEVRKIIEAIGIDYGDLNGFLSGGSSSADPCIRRGGNGE